VQQTRGPEQSSKSAEARFQVTLEVLDRYIRYRTESDAALVDSANAVTEPAPGDSSAPREIRISIKQMYEADLKVRAKYGLVGEDFTPLDRMVRDVCDARFRSESAALKAMLQSHEKNAASGTDEQLRAMSQAMLGYLRKQMEVDPELRDQRTEYGDANVDMILRREKELKAIWVRKDAAAAKVFQALPASPSAGSISL
jgi:hypothetical protein